MEKVNITLYDDNVKLKYKSDGVEIVKNVSVPDLISAIEKDIVIRTGLLGTGVREYTLKGHKAFFTVEFPPKVRPLLYIKSNGEKLNFKVPWPALLFIFYLSNGKAQSSSCFATKEPLWNPRVNLFMFPFGNADRDGRICWGHGGSPKEEFYSANITNLGRMFIESPFNNHLSNGIFKSPRGVNIERAVELLRYLDGKDKFPFDILRLCNTYEEVIDRFLRGHDV